MALELVPTSKELFDSNILKFDSNILKGNTEQSRSGTLTSHTHVQVRIIGPMGLGPSIVIRGLGPRPSRPGALLQTEGWDHGPCHKARV